jgi:hypothetical protein
MRAGRLARRQGDLVDFYPVGPADLAGEIAGQQMCPGDGARAAPRAALRRAAGGAAGGWPG